MSFQPAFLPEETGPAYPLESPAGAAGGESGRKPAAATERTAAFGAKAGMSTSYLEITGLTVSFGGFRAVDGVDLRVFEGELRFLIGPNGAGKTTMIDAITGLAPATGQVELAGVQLLGKKIHHIARLGVGRTFQTASIFEELTVLQNLDIAAGAARPWWARLRRRRGVEPGIARALETAKLTEFADTLAGVLPHGRKQWLEIAMLLVQDSQVLLLDEPVAGMSLEEREETGELLRRIAQDHIVIIVEHDMEFMRAFADSVTVMHQGTVLVEGDVESIQTNAAVREVYLGSGGEE